MGLTFTGGQCRPLWPIPLQDPVWTRVRKSCSWKQFKCQFKEFMTWQGEIFHSGIQFLQCHSAAHAILGELWLLKSTQACLSYWGMPESAGYGNQIVTQIPWWKWIDSGWFWKVIQDFCCELLPSSLLWCDVFNYHQVLTTWKTVKVACLFSPSPANDEALFHEGTGRLQKNKCQKNTENELGNSRYISHI